MRILFRGGVLDTADCADAVLDVFRTASEDETKTPGDHEAEFHTCVDASQEALNEFAQMTRLSPGSVSQRLRSMSFELAAQVLTVADYFGLEDIVEPCFRFFVRHTRFMDSKLVSTLASVVPDGRFECAATVKSEVSFVFDIAVLRDGRVAFCCDLKIIRIMNVEAGSCAVVNTNTVVLCLAALPDGNLASGCADMLVHIWDTRTRLCTATLAGHNGRVQCIAPLPSGTTLASASEDKTIKIWDLPTQRCTATLAGHTGEVSVLAVLHSGVLASGSKDRTIRLWNVLDGACIATLEGHDERVRDLQVMPDGTLVSCSSETGVMFWDPEAHRLKSVLPSPDRVHLMAVMPDGRLLCVSPGGIITTLDLHAQGRHITRGEDVQSIAAFTRDRVVTGGLKSFKIWMPLASEQSKREALASLGLKTPIVDRIVAA